MIDGVGWKGFIRKRLETEYVIICTCMCCGGTVAPLCILSNVVPQTTYENVPKKKD